jgi:hypothetical protein
MILIFQRKLLLSIKLRLNQFINIWVHYFDALELLYNDRFCNLCHIFIVQFIVKVYHVIKVKPMH